MHAHILLVYSVEESLPICPLFLHAFRCLSRCHRETLHESSKGGGCRPCQSLAAILNQDVRPKCEFTWILALILPPLEILSLPNLTQGFQSWGSRNHHCLETGCFFESRWQTKTSFSVTFLYLPLNISLPNSHDFTPVPPQPYLEMSKIEPWTTEHLAPTAFWKAAVQLQQLVFSSTLLLNAKLQYNHCSN